MRTGSATRIARYGTGWTMIGGESRVARITPSRPRFRMDLADGTLGIVPRVVDDPRVVVPVTVGLTIVSVRDVRKLVASLTEVSSFSSAAAFSAAIPASFAKAS